MSPNLLLQILSHRSLSQFGFDFGCCRCFGDVLRHRRRVKRARASMPREVNVLSNAVNFPVEGTARSVCDTPQNFWNILISGGLKMSQ